MLTPGQALRIVQKSKRQVVIGIVVTLLFAAIIAYRGAKILDRAKQKRVLAESVSTRFVWDIEIPSKEFVGDLSQVGNWLVYALPDTKGGVSQMFVRDLGQGISTPVDMVLAPAMSPDANVVGRSKLGKKEFRIEQDQGRSIITQYNIATGARGLLARLPRDCSYFKTVQRLPQNFFALETLCVPVGNPGRLVKRLIVVDFETRRLTYASLPLPLGARFVAFR